jgi:hypothetical protein
MLSNEKHNMQLSRQAVRLLVMTPSLQPGDRENFDFIEPTAKRFTDLQASSPLIFYRVLASHYEQSDSAAT